MRISRRELIAALSTLALTAPALLKTQLAHAQSYPERPIRLIVNFSAGGTSDVMARAMANPVSKILGQQVVVENRPGALGVIGAGEVTRAKPDGYTILLTTQGSLTESPVLSSHVPYDPLTAFEPITLVGESPLALFAHPDFPANNVEELVEYGKNQPDGIDIAVTGSSVRLGAYALEGAAGIRFVQIPYGGQGPALTAAMGGHTSLALNTFSTALTENVRAGLLKFLGVGSKEPYALMPEVPPISNTLPGYEAKAWWGLFAPAGTPKDVIAKLTDAFTQSVRNPDVTSNFESNGVLPMTSTPEELNEMVVSGLEQTRILVEQHSISRD